MQAAEDGMISCASDKQELEHAMKTLRDQIKQADERETAQKESMAAEEQTVVEMSKQIATMNQEIGTLNDTIQKADSAKTDHLKAVADLEQENEKQYETFDQEKTDLKAQLNQAQQQHEEEAVKLKDQLAESQQQIVNNKDVFEERENAISELQGVLSHLGCPAISAARHLHASPSRVSSVALTRALLQFGVCFILYASVSLPLNYDWKIDTPSSVTIPATHSYSHYHFIVFLL